VKVSELEITVATNAGEVSECSRLCSSTARSKIKLETEIGMPGDSKTVLGGSVIVFKEIEAGDSFLGGQL